MSGAGCAGLLRWPPGHSGPVLSLWIGSILCQSSFNLVFAGFRVAISGHYTDMNLVVQQRHLQIILIYILEETAHT